MVAVLDALFQALKDKAAGKMQIAAGDPAGLFSQERKAVEQGERKGCTQCNLERSR